MKILVASDIHGSAYYAQKIIQSVTYEKADVLVLLGDIYNHGPRNPFPRDYDPMKVAEILNNFGNKLVVVKGNCDSEVDEMISEFSFVNMAQEFVGDKKVTFTHGHIFNEENIPQGVGDILCYGHFHKAFIKKCGNVIVANPGSVSLPKDDINGYLIIDKNYITLKELTTYKTIQKQEIRSLDDK